MTAQELYKFLRDWMLLVRPATPVVRAYQDAAPPTTGQYLVIDDSAEWEPYGRASVGDLGEDGVRDLKHEYTVEVGLIDVRGDGEALRDLLENLETRDAQLLFQAAGVSVLKPGVVKKMPQLLDSSKWLREHRLDLTLGVARVKSETVGIFTSVEFVADFHGQV